MFSLHGFGTLGLVHSDAEDADFVGNFFQPDGAGYSGSWAAGVDSKLGVQLDAHHGDQLSAVVQLVSQYRYDGTYTPQIEWANVKYQFTPDFSVRAGRTVAGPFLLSDARLVGYTYPWIRPPQEVYGVLPVTNMDGVGASYRFQFSRGTDLVNVAYGRTHLKLPGGGGIDARQFFEASNTLEIGPGTFRIGYSSIQVDLHSPSVDPVFDGLEDFGTAQALALRDRYQPSDFPYSVLSLSLSIDPGDWLLMAEWAANQSSGVVSDTRAWYVSGGYRFGKFTPYLTLARLRAETISEPGLSTEGLTAEQAATAAALNSGLNGVIKYFAFAQKSLSVGIRWDFMANASLKLQYERVLLDSDANGRLGNIQPGFEPGQTVNVFSVATDFVF
ncbi:hypothetical protein [Hydrocarboniphaga sp.]|uniref:hypothetical protein n=1 Tax=Hydrocarboniphaga sp. TaxID=2033016 RepID=UPI00260D72E6|nr:hypothetical protein [Hydrocarboniphaga sp.]